MNDLAIGTPVLKRSVEVGSTVVVVLAAMVLVSQSVVPTREGLVNGTLHCRPEIGWIERRELSTRYLWEGKGHRR